MKQRFLLSVFALLTGCLSSAPVVICTEERVFPAEKTVARLVIQHEVKRNLPDAHVSISFLTPRDKALLNKFQTYGDRADVFAPRSKAIVQLIEVITQKLETRTNFSLYFDLGLGEKNVVAQFVFLKNGSVCVTLVTTTSGVPERIVNVLKAILLDETVIQKHWGKGLLVAGIAVIGFWYAYKAGLLDDLGKSLRKNPSGDDHVPAGEKTLENYFGDYAHNTKTFPYTCDALTSASVSTDVAPLRAIIGTLDAEGNLNSGMSFADAEGCHCWIQWAFPTLTPSRFNLKALVSSPQFQELMKSNDKLRNVLFLCFRYYLNFMGLDLSAKCDLKTTQDAISFVKTTRFEEGIENFLNKSHNWLRVTRIIESLRIHGLSEYARAFSAFLTQKQGLEVWVAGFISKTSQSQNIWEKAPLE